MSRKKRLARSMPMLLAVVAVIAIWFMPDIETEAVDAGMQPREAYGAVVVDPAPPPPDTGDELSAFGQIIVRIAEGPRQGEDVRAFVNLQSVEAAPVVFDVGDEVVLTFTDDFDGTAFAAVSERYRLPVLGLLVLVFSLAMILVGGWQGLRALIALGLTVVLVAKLFIPAILNGVPPVPLAVGLAMLVTVVTIVLSEGMTRVGLAAILGTLCGLVITALLAAFMTSMNQFTGSSIGELAWVTFSSGEQLDAGGILLAGIILGAVGVLDDVTVTQAATIQGFAMRSRGGVRHLWQRGFRVGRSHIAATTNTLFLAYVGASLPAIVFLVVVAEPTLLTLNREVLALEIVRTLVGSIGIILAMPLTTLIAALLIGGRESGSAQPPV